MTEQVRLKLILAEQVEDLAVRNAKMTLEHDSNYTQNKLLSIPVGIYEEFNIKMEEIVEIANESDEKADRTWIDNHLYDFFLKYELTPNIAGSIEFWNSITIQTESALELIKKRWKHSLDWFRTNGIERRGKDYNEIRRYAVINQTHLERLTFARIWWIANIFPPEFQETVLLQQDFIEYVVGNRYVFWDQFDPEKNQMSSRVMNLVIQELAEFDKRKANQESEFTPINRQTLNRRVFNYLTLFNDTATIETVSDNELQQTVKEFYEVAMREQLEK